MVSDILTAPRKEEAVYLGYLTQAYFGQQLLRATDRMRNVDREHLSTTCFVADSSLLVPALARGSEGHVLARRMIEGLRELECGLVTTSLLLDETWEHAHWAAALVQKHGEDSSALVDASRGVRGYRQNLFIEGYVRGPNAPSGATFRDYLRQVFPKLSGLGITRAQVEDALLAMGVRVVKLEQWGGFDPIAFPQIDGLEEQTRDRRKQAGTFKQPRQTRAEAEAVLVVSKVREQSFLLEGRRFGDGFFLSHTRIVEGLDGYPQRIMLLPEGLAEWLFTSRPFGETEAAALFNVLLWELGVSGIKFVSDELVQRRFSGMVTASRSTLLRTVAARRDVLVEKYGPDPEDAFRKVHALDTPFLLDTVVELALRKAQEEKTQAERRASTAEAQAALTAAEKQELARLRADKAEKRRKSERRSRSGKTAKNKRRRRRKAKKARRRRR